jgi:hypothetical protein
MTLSEDADDAFLATCCADEGFPALIDGHGHDPVDTAGRAGPGSGQCPPGHEGVPGGEVGPGGEENALPVRPHQGEGGTVARGGQGVGIGFQGVVYGAGHPRASIVRTARHGRKLEVLVGEESHNHRGVVSHGHHEPSIVGDAPRSDERPGRATDRSEEQLPEGVEDNIAMAHGNDRPRPSRGHQRRRQSCGGKRVGHPRGGCRRTRRQDEKAGTRRSQDDPEAGPDILRARFG